MRQSRLLLPLIVVCAFVGYLALNFTEGKDILSPVEVNPKFHKASYPLTDFYPGIEQTNYRSSINSHVYGGIVSHHLLAAEDIAKFFAEFRSQAPETIVIIGPNHFSVGEETIAVSKRTYLTPWGEIAADIETIDALLSKKAVILNEEPFIEEHSMAALVSYIAYNYPSAKIVPIVVKRQVARTQLDRLAANLHELLPSGAVVIASVDFSHHLNKAATEFHDVASVSAIAEFDFDRVFNLEIDSPASIYTLLKYLDARGARKLLFKNTDSTDYTGNVASEDLTSYVFGHFIKGESSVTTAAISLHFGSMGLTQQINNWIEGGGDPFQNIQGVEGNFLRGVDLVTANFTGIITENNVCDTDKDFLLRSNLDIVSLLKKYRFSGVTLTNNYSPDCLAVSLSNTIKVLADEGLFTISPSLDEPSGMTSKEVGRQRIALLAIDAIKMREDKLLSVYQKIEVLDKEYDSIVIHVNWGYNYVSDYPEEQQQIAYKLIDSGVDVVIGHHPNIVQGIEKYKQGLIFYSLGNFVSDQLEISAKTGFGVGLVHGESKISGFIFPYQIESFKPTLLPYREMSAFCRDILGEIAGDIPCSF